jgi:hypothetical protein
MMAKLAKYLPDVIAGIKNKYGPAAVSFTSEQIMALGDEILNKMAIDD